MSVLSSLKTNHSSSSKGIHGTLIEANAECPDCRAWFETKPDAAAMTPEERAAEMERWGGVLEVEFSLVHKRIEELVGRPVWTHEMSSMNFPGLVEEARRRPGTVNVEALLDKLP